MYKKFIVIFSLLVLSFPKNNFSQQDSTSINPNKLVLNPKFFAIQFDAVSSLVSSEIGLSLDYDLYSSPNTKHNFGFRFSAEHYGFLSLDVGGKTEPGPFLDVNILGRYSLRGERFGFSPVIGLSYHNSMDEEYPDNAIYFKWGFEIKFNLFTNHFGLLLKIAKSSTNYGGYGGIGLAICL
ncbi:MAG: hypothetical protein WAR79_10460 [Melioribacteraceae bacterium]